MVNIFFFQIIFFISYTLYGKYKKGYKINKFKASTSTWNYKIQLPDGSCSVPHIQD